MASVPEKRLLKVLAGERLSTPPVWLMRQAGRYLPEYRELRSRTKNFLEFCYTPSIATEATLQPLRRYDFDASILFADILLILDAMGRNLRFETGEGPILDPLTSAADLDKVPDAKVIDRLSPVFETVDRLSTALPSSTTLIGFAGSPWTVAVYAIEGRGGTEKVGPRMWAYERPDDLIAVIDRITVLTIDYLEQQVKAGAEVLMLFDSWASGLPDPIFETVSIAPTKAIVDGLRGRGVTVPVVGFPRGSGAMLKPYAEQTGVQAVGIDTSQPASYVRAALSPDIPVQGHLDPLSLIAGGDRLKSDVARIIDGFSDRPHIFNLGHGILPQTPPQHVDDLLRYIRRSG